MRKLSYPIVPLVLALVLGILAENSLRQAFAIPGGSFFFLLQPTICVVVVIASILAYLAPVTQWALKGMGRVNVDTGSHP
jgi:putative tricarboxylic transport membrane protein